MNTLSYFLSTLRPSPPPSPRASTSHLPIPLDDAHASGLSASSPSSAVLVTRNDFESQPQPSQLRHSTLPLLDPPLESLINDTDTDSSRDGDRGGERGGGSIVTDEEEKGDAVQSSGFRGDVTAPRTGIVPPSRRGSRKGKSKAVFGTGESEGNDKESLASFTNDQIVSTTLPSPSSSVDTMSSTADHRTSWPFMTRIARMWPFRLTASLYILIRRFLSIFGLSYPPRPHLNALLASASNSLSTEPDPEKHATSSTSTIVSLSISSSSSSQPPTPIASPPPSPSPTTSSPFALSVPRPIRTPRMTPKTLVLDLDETLIHSTSRPTSSRRGGRSVPKGLKTTMVEVVLDGRSTMYTVYKRPWVDFFLRKVSSWYTVIIFTASLPEYADPVIDWLDGGDGRGGLIGGRLFRAHCLAKNGTYVKDLTVVDPDLAKVCLVDNSPVSYAINQANGIPIEGWINDPNDECLLDLLPMLDSLRFTNDVRRVLGLRGFGKTSSSSSTVGSGLVGGNLTMSSMSSSVGGMKRSEGRKRSSDR